MSLHSRIADLLVNLSVDTLDALAFGPCSQAGPQVAGALATQILDIIARTQPMPNAAALEDAGGVAIDAERPQSPAAPVDPVYIADSYPLPDDLTPALNAELARLCAAAGLRYHDIAFHEGQPSVVASDPDGLREYYTLATLRAMAAGAEASSGFDTARRRSAHRAGLLSSRGPGQPTRASCQRRG